MNTEKQPEPAGPVHTGRVAAGAIIMTMGVVMLLDRSELLGGNLWHAFPGFILIALGLVSLANQLRLQGAAAEPAERSVADFHRLVAHHELPAPVRIQLGQLVAARAIVAGGTMIVLKEVFPGLREERGKGRG